MRYTSRLRSTTKPATFPVRISPRIDRFSRTEEDRRFLRTQLFAEMARDDRARPDIVEAALRRLQKNPIPGAVVLVQIDALAGFPQDYDEESVVEIRKPVSRLVNDVFADLPNSIIHDISDARFAIIASAGPDSVLSEAQLRSIVERLCRTAKLSCRESLTIGTGPVCFQISQLARSYSEAREALTYQILLGDGRVIAWSDVQRLRENQSTTESHEPYPIHQERKVRERIIAGDKEGARAALDTLLSLVRTQPGLTPTAFKSYILQMAIILCRSASRIGADVSALTEANILHAQTILETDSYAALHAFLHDLMDEIIDAALGRGRTPKSDVVVLAKKYIAENYAKSPSLREVANYVHLSPHYFSRLFAKENDCGFQDYLNLVRIEAAKDLLRNSPVKTKQAAGRVGFKDVSHFVRLFRRMEGMTPAKFARSVGQVKV